MILYKITFDRRKERDRHLLADLGSIHRGLLKILDTNPLEDRMLFRIHADPKGQEVYLYVQSAKEFPENQALYLYDIGKRLDAVQEGDILSYNISVVPQKSEPPASPHARGKKRYILQPAEFIPWWEKKAESNGFLVGNTSVISYGFHKVSRTEFDQGKTFSLFSATLQGKLKVTNLSAFRHAVLHGIGREKAFGQGLLLVH